MKTVFSGNDHRAFGQIGASEVRVPAVIGKKVPNGSVLVAAPDIQDHSFGNFGKAPGGQCSAQQIDGDLGAPCGGCPLGQWFNKIGEQQDDHRPPDSEGGYRRPDGAGSARDVDDMQFVRKLQRAQRPRHSNANADINDLQGQRRGGQKSLTGKGDHILALGGDQIKNTQHLGQPDQKRRHQKQGNRSPGGLQDDISGKAAQTILILAGGR